MKELEKDENKQNISNSFKQAIDKVIEFISSSKSTLQILTERHSIGDERKAEAAKQNVKELIKRKVLNEFQKTDDSNETLTQIHINESFNKKADSNVRCSIVYDEDQSRKREESVYKQRHTPTNFLDEQYNLTKQAIARRYRPQMKMNSMTSKNTMRDFLNDPFNDELHRISGVASEKIRADKFKKSHFRKNENNPLCNKPATPTLETHVIYEK